MLDLTNTRDRGLAGFPLDNTGPFLSTKREISASSSFASPYYVEERLKNTLPVRTISSQVVAPCIGMRLSFL